MVHFYAEVSVSSILTEKCVVSVEENDDPDYETDAAVEKIKKGYGEGFEPIGTEVTQNGDESTIHEIKQISEDKARELTPKDEIEITVHADLSDVNRSHEEIEGIVQERLQEAIWNMKEQFPSIAGIPISVE